MEGEYIVKKIVRLDLSEEEFTLLHEVVGLVSLKEYDQSKQKRVMKLYNAISDLNDSIRCKT